MARRPADGRRPGLGLLLGTLCSTTFVVTGAGTSLAPFLLDMARDLGRDLAAVSNLVALQSATWGLMSLAAGAASDRLGRRPILILGVLLLGGARLGLAGAEAYGWAAAAQLLGGLGGGAYMGTVFATVSDQVPAAQRGRALGWVITGQSLSFVLGVPLVTLLGAVAGWRGAMLAQGAVSLVAAAAVWLAVPPMTTTRPGEAPAVGAVLRVLDLRVLTLLAAGTTERACFAAMGVYLATYLLTSYGVSLAQLAVALALIALGNLVGNVLGSQLADRLPARPLVFAAASVATGLLALPLLGWQPGVGISIALGFAYALANALGRPALMAALSEVPGEVRGAILGLNITTASLGWLGATTFGGWLITRHGFGSLGLFGAATALAGAALASLGWWATRARSRRRP